MIEASRVWLKAQKLLAERQSSKAAAKVQMVAAHEQHLRLIEKFWQMAKAKHDMGFLSDSHVAEARTALEEARVMLDEVQAKETIAVAELRKALVKAGQEQWQGYWQEYLAGKVMIDSVLAASAMLLKAESKSAENMEALIAAHQAHLNRMREVEKISKEKHEARALPSTQYAQATYYRIEAELELARLVKR